MRFFHNDYNEICHPLVWKAMEDSRTTAYLGYGEDAICKRAADKIRMACQADNANVHFLVGGTQTNLTVISAALRPHQGVIAPNSAHIHVHETGAIEATGHKVLTLPSNDGKITAEQIRSHLEAHFRDADRVHTVQPKMVYLSQSTEWGTIYSLAELEAIRLVCDAYRLYLFVDGARLGYALTAKGADVTLPDLARLCDVFYIGGTKQGAMFGEAVVITNAYIAEDFRYLIKQHGGMLAKGWLLGVQFDALFTDELYFSIAAQANHYADSIRAVCIEQGYDLFLPGVTNQVFPILPDKLLALLSRDVTFSEMGRIDDNHRAVRFCTSWATKSEDITFLCGKIREYGTDL